MADTIKQVKGERDKVTGNSDNIQIFILAHNIRSLENVGSIFRTSDSFGVSKIFLSGYTGKPPAGKISKTALGAENFVPWEYKLRPSLVIKQLKKEFPNLLVLGLENNIKYKTIPLSEFKSNQPILLVLGTETTGIPDSLLKLCDVVTEIEMYGQKESLNLAVAFGIALYALTKN